MWRRISTIRLNGSPAARVVLGVALAAFAQLLAIFLAGAGHGWLAPLLFSFALWLLIPLTLALAWPTAEPRMPTLAVMTAVAIAADMLLLKQSLGEADDLYLYIRVNGAVGYAIIASWLALWLFWQVLLVHAVITRRKAYN